MSKVVGVDVGFSAVKAVRNGKQVLFPSVVGAPLPESTYSMTAENGLVIKVNGAERFTPVGKTALLHSAYTAGRRDSSWVGGPEWRTLFVTALSELSIGAPYEPFNVVVGLPVYDWNQYAGQVRQRILGKIDYERRGRERQVAQVENALVITQPYGSLLNHALDHDGDVIDNVWSTGLVAVVDLGGNTMNLLVCNELEEVGRWTASNEFGLLHALDNVKNKLRQQFNRFSPETHEVAEWLAEGTFRHRGQVHQIWQYAKDDLEPLISMVLTSMDEAWPQASRYEAVLLTGGGSAAIGKYLATRMGDYANVTLASDPRWSNVHGYHKLAKQVFK